MGTEPSPRLTDHARIAIVGGGPAGSFFALHALSLAAQLDLRLNLTIFERKDLSAAGPRGCNMCAGILSRRTVEGLAALDIALPPEVVMGIVRRYQLHWGNHTISIHPPDPTREVISVYRAGGPRNSPYAPTAGFDAFLLSQAQARGAQVVAERVERVIFDPLPRVRTSAREETFDLVVLACGVNATPPILADLDYSHPPTEAMAQDALLIETAAARASMDSTVHIYFDQPRELIFGALIPKRHFATVSLLGRHMPRDMIEQFLATPQVVDVVGGAPPRLCGCRPHVAIATARGFYADRFVAVGDACVTRLYKDGIGSAWVTARAAAETALRHGVSRAAFAVDYAPVCRAIARDNRFGRAVFRLVDHSKRNQLFLRAVGRVLKSETDQAPNGRALSRTLWALFTGDADYAEIFRMIWKPRSLVRVATAMVQELVSAG
ncbi:MAG: FAD-dependent oxidoreductase [Chloroflexota bacterium]|nr:FAD-dependent oxidoreductase [Chloroflexota bacterium]